MPRMLKTLIYTLIFKLFTRVIVGLQTSKYGYLPKETSGVTVADSDSNIALTLMAIAESEKVENFMFD